jgi:hypothetical protein
LFVFVCLFVCFCFVCFLQDLKPPAAVAGTETNDQSGLSAEDLGISDSDPYYCYFFLKISDFSVDSQPMRGAAATPLIDAVLTNNNSVDTFQGEYFLKEEKNEGNPVNNDFISFFF